MILVTGAAGFIGYHVSRALLDRGEQVIGIDDLNDYYDPALKRARLALLDRSDFTFRQLNVADGAGMQVLFRDFRPSRVVHLAAQAGVRYSLTNPYAYGSSNLSGFLNVLEECRQAEVEHLVFASSSSVYGANTSLPFSEKQSVDHPVSLYAATKKSNELMAHAYAHLFRIPMTGLRFFTVYGPWGRPDMALFKFTKSIIEGERIAVFNEGKMIRDFTYIDDIVEGVLRVLDHPATPDSDWDSDNPAPDSSNAPWRVFNIGNNEPVLLLDFIRLLEESLGISARIEFLPLQPGDVLSTMADVSALERATGFRPRTSVRDGISRFVTWYREYYGV